jgi:hypothetical protein
MNILCVLLLYRNQHHDRACAASFQEEGVDDPNFVHAFNAYSK